MTNRYLEKIAETYNRQRYNDYVRNRKDTEGALTKGIIGGASTGLGLLYAKDRLAEEAARQSGKVIPLEQKLHQNMNLRRGGKAMLAGAAVGGAVAALMNVPPHKRRFNKDKNVAGVQDYENEHISRTGAGVITGTAAGLATAPLSAHVAKRITDAVYRGKIPAKHALAFSIATGAAPVIAAHYGSKIGEKWADKENVQTARNIRYEYYGK